MAFRVTDISKTCRLGVSCQSCGGTIRVQEGFIDSCLSQPPDAEMLCMYQGADVATWISGRRIMEKRYATCALCKCRETYQSDNCLICGDSVITGTNFCKSHVCQSRSDGKQCKHARTVMTTMCPEHTLLYVMKGKEARCPYLVANLKLRVKA